MGFKEAVRTCLREKFFTLKGRASRSEYWYFSLFFFIYVLALFAILFAIGGLKSTSTGEFSKLLIVVFGIGAIGVIILYIPYITLMVRRFHDRGLSGWWVLAVVVLSSVPVVGFIVGIVSLVITVSKGTDGENKFGPDPLQAQNRADVFS